MCVCVCVCVCGTAFSLWPGVAACPDLCRLLDAEPLQYERARVVYKFALDRIPKQEAQVRFRMCVCVCVCVFFSEASCILSHLSDLSLSLRLTASPRFLTHATGALRQLRAV